jgi:inorganic pyrophosphatase/exopolyphosphatase
LKIIRSCIPQAHGKKLVISVLEIAGSPNPVVKYKDDILKEMEELRKEKNVDNIYFFVVDVVTQSSVLICQGEKSGAESAEASIADLAFGVESADGKKELKTPEENLKIVGNYASRKKEFFPRIQVGMKEYLKK